MIPFHLVLAAVLFAFAIGIMLGHAAGYMRAEDVARRHDARTMTSGPRYVGTPK